MARRVYVVALVLCFSAAIADSSTWDAAIGGGLGGAAGAAIGNEIGGRDGAIIGGAIGGGVGAAVATDRENPRETTSPYRGHMEYGRQPTHHFCPPGQAKKGRC